MEQNFQMASKVISQVLERCNAGSTATVQYTGLANQLLWQTVGLPSDTLALDVIANHQTVRDLTLEECAWTGIMYFGLMFVCIALIDFLVTRPVTWTCLKLFGKSTTGFTKTSWMLLHATFNFYIMVISWQEMWMVFFDPLNASFSPIGWWGSYPGAMLGVISIGCFHMHHFVFFEFTFEDIIHHLTNAGIVVVIGVMTPWGRLVALSNMAMCAVPGGLNYLALWLRKFDWISTQNQKQLNRFLNIVLRYPIQLCSFYIYIISVVNGKLPKCHWFTHVLMVVGLLAHTLNSLYYCDQVVGNYAVYQERKKNGGEKMSVAEKSKGGMQAHSQKAVPKKKTQ